MQLVSIHSYWDENIRGCKYIDLENKILILEYNHAELLSWIKVETFKLKTKLHHEMYLF